MKQCPFCKAELSDEANFCLYCMTSLDQKETVTPLPKHRKRWVLVVLSLLLVLTLLLVIFQGKNTPVPVDNATPTATDADRNSIPADSALADETASASSFVHDSQQTEAQPSSTGSVPAHVTSFAASSSAQSSRVSQPNSWLPESSKANTSQNEVSSVPSDDVVYLVRDAVKTDDFNLSSTVTQGAVVVIGVSRSPSDGVFRIPETIGGKPVVAVMANAFTSVKGQVKTVILPPSVKTVWNFAFAGCTELSHVYLEGKAIYIEAQAFDQSARFTLHCSADCSDRNFRYYKNTASQYGGVYEEWNG
ncbi:MAG: hypothetical protein IJP35_01375 [Clostridia bacterium]|nr:hypothetical protein [Clostridia bacterium]